MKIDFEFKKPLDQIVTDIFRMENILEKDQADLMKKIGKELKKEVVKLLPKSNSTDDGYQTGEYEHMREDIKITVNGQKEKTGISGVTIHGGKNTSYKWHMLDEGTRNPDGSIHTPAKHFTDKAMKAAEERIERLIDALERKVTES